MVAGLPRLTTCVPREYVHRAAINEVFLTGWETDGADGFIVGAQWPRSHALFAPRFGQQDPLLIAETIRQAGSLLAHAEYGVPLGHQFLMWALSFSAEPGGLTAEPVPTEPVLRITCAPVVRGGQLAAMRYHATVWRGDVCVAKGHAAYSCTSPAVYRRLRGGRSFPRHLALPAPVDPRVVGRTGVQHVVLGVPGPRHLPPGTRAFPHARRWLLRTDTAHPTLFDHPVDHVPGMVLLEAARQAAHAVSHPAPVLITEASAAFTRYAEFDPPCWIEAEPGVPDTDGTTAVAVTGTQQGETVFTATVRTTRAR
nr:ScbA/BarX family gamma-butyrolactone biosynthesis protein [Streptomyces sp. SID5468]